MAKKKNNTPEMTDEREATIGRLHACHAQLGECVAALGRLADASGGVRNLGPSVGRLLRGALANAEDVQREIGYLVPITNEVLDEIEGQRVRIQLLRDRLPARDPDDFRSFPPGWDKE